MGIPSGTPIKTMEILELLLNKFPPKAKTVYRVTSLPHNIIVASKLCNIGYTIHLYKQSCEVEYQDEINYYGWCSNPTRLWILPLTSKGNNTKITLTNDPDKCNPSNGIVIATIHYHAQLIYTCQKQGTAYQVLPYQP